MDQVQSAGIPGPVAKFERRKTHSPGGSSPGPLDADPLPSAENMDRVQAGLPILPGGGPGPSNHTDSVLRQVIIGQRGGPGPSRSTQRKVALVQSRRRPPDIRSSLRHVPGPPAAGVRRPGRGPASLRKSGHQPNTKTHRFGGCSNPHRQRYMTACRELLATGEPPRETTSASSDAAGSPESRCPKCESLLACSRSTERPGWKIVMCGPHRPHWYDDG